MYKLVFPFLLLVTLGVVRAVSADESGNLDGVSFRATLTEEGKNKGDADVLQFENGKLLSTGCVPWGFMASSYSSQKNKDGSVRFFCQMTDAKKTDKMDWDGTVRGDALQASMIWTRKDGKQIHYSVVATRQ